MKETDEQYGEGLFHLFVIRLAISGSINEFTVSKN
jgi:hypothetical protein